MSTYGSKAPAGLTQYNPKVTLLVRLLVWLQVLCPRKSRSTKIPLPKGATYLMLKSWTHKWPKDDPFPPNRNRRLDPHKRIYWTNLVLLIRINRMILVLLIKKTGWSRPTDKNKRMILVLLIRIKHLNLNTTTEKEVNTGERFDPRKPALLNCLQLILAQIDWMYLLAMLQVLPRWVISLVPEPGPGVTQPLLLLELWHWSTTPVDFGTNRLDVLTRNATGPTEMGNILGFLNQVLE